VYAIRQQGSEGVFVQAFPGPSLRKQVTSGGSFPVWRKDGKEIVYLRGAEIWSVHIYSDGRELRFDPPQKLFSGVRLYTLNNNWSPSLGGLARWLTHLLSTSDRAAELEYVARQDWLVFRQTAAKLSCNSNSTSAYDGQSESGHSN